MVKTLGKIKKTVKEYLIKRFGLNRVERFVPNINLDNTRKQKKVLLIYLDLFGASNSISKDKENAKSGMRHTNNAEFFQIINALIKMDCCIDVCIHNEPEAKEYLKKKEYDVIIGLGTMFRYAVENSSAYKILYMTENPYEVSYKREMERIEYFKERTGREAALYRTGMFFKQDDDKKVDAIICMGEEKYFDKLEIPVKRIAPSAFYNVHFKDRSRRRKTNFLVLGTDGFIHKGNDLLVQVFNCHPEWDLFMCGYHVTREAGDLGLYMSDNIHDCGYVDIESDAFLELAEKCTFLLQPSCSEASSTAVLTGMRHAMIPIVMHGNGFDLWNEYCMFFEGYQLKDIERTIEEAMGMQEQKIDMWCQKICDFANDEFSLKRFSERIFESLQELI